MVQACGSSKTPVTTRNALLQTMTLRRYSKKIAVYLPRPCSSILYSPHPPINNHGASQIRRSSLPLSPPHPFPRRRRRPWPKTSSPRRCRLVSKPIKALSSQRLLSFQCTHRADLQSTTGPRATWPKSTTLPTSIPGLSSPYTISITAADGRPTRCAACTVWMTRA